MRAKSQTGLSIWSTTKVTPACFSCETASSKSGTSKATVGPLAPDGSHAFDMARVILLNSYSIHCLPGMPSISSSMMPGERPRTFS